MHAGLVFRFISGILMNAFSNQVYYIISFNCTGVLAIFKHVSTTALWCSLSFKQSPHHQPRSSSITSSLPLLNTLPSITASTNPNLLYHVLPASLRRTLRVRRIHSPSFEPSPTCHASPHSHTASTRRAIYLIQLTHAESTTSVLKTPKRTRTTTPSRCNAPTATRSIRTGSASRVLYVLTPVKSDILLMMDRV